MENVVWAIIFYLAMFFILLAVSVNAALVFSVVFVSVVFTVVLVKWAIPESLKHMED